MPASGSRVETGGWRLDVGGVHTLAGGGAENDSSLQGWGTLDLLGAVQKLPRLQATCLPEHSTSPAPHPPGAGSLIWPQPLP